MTVLPPPPRSAARPGLSPILAEARAELLAALGERGTELRVERAVIGLFFTGILLSDGATGAAATPLQSLSRAVCCPSSLEAWPFPGRLRGRRAVDLLDELAAEGVRRAVGLATLNALAESLWRTSPPAGVRIETGRDAFEAAAIAPHERVVVVGAFPPFLRALKRMGQDYLVLETDPARLKPDELPRFRPPEQASAVAAEADVLLITGTTLLNDTLEPLLAAAPPAARIVMAGPSAGLWPFPCFRRNVSILGGIRVTAAEAFLDTLAEGGSGYHLFGRSAEKVVLRSVR